MSPIPLLLFIGILILVVLLFFALRRRGTSAETPSDSYTLRTAQDAHADGYVQERAGESQRPAAADFSMTIEDVFSIKGRGTIVTGRVAAGVLRLNETVWLTLPDGAARFQTRVTGIEMFRKTLDTAQTGDNVGLLLENVARDRVARDWTVSGR